MIRSRLLFIFLFLAYLGVTPAGVYTCACLMPVDPLSESLDLDDLFDPPSVTNTAVSTLLSYLTLSFIGAAMYLFVAQRDNNSRYALFWFEPYRFCLPPPTPPPSSLS